MSPDRDRHFDEVWRAKFGVDRRSLDLALNQRATTALKLLLPGKCLLDIGCGIGSLGETALRKFTTVEGVDISGEAVRAALERGVRARAMDVGSEPLPYPDQMFDAVTALSVLQYVVDVQAVLRECRRVLRPGGQFIVAVPNMRAAWRLWRLALEGKFPRTSLDDVGLDGGTLHYFTCRTMSGLLSECNFEVAWTMGIFCRPRWLDNRRPRGPFRWLQREFFSGEVLLDARAT